MTTFITPQQLNYWFATPDPDTLTEDTHARAAYVRHQYHELAETMNEMLPEGPDKTVAIRAIRDAMLQAVAVLDADQVKRAAHAALTPPPEHT